MIIAKITTEQAETLKGKEFVKDNFFNPIQDKHGNWIISLQELVYCSEDFAKSVELVTFEPIETELK